MRRACSASRALRASSRTRAIRVETVVLSVGSGYASRNATSTASRLADRLGRGVLLGDGLLGGLFPRRVHHREQLGLERLESLAARLRLGVGHERVARGRARGHHLLERLETLLDRVVGALEVALVPELGGRGEGVLARPLEERAGRGELALQPLDQRLALLEARLDVRRVRGGRARRLRLPVVLRQRPVIVDDARPLRLRVDLALLDRAEAEDSHVELGQLALGLDLADLGLLTADCPDDLAVLPLDRSPSPALA